MEAVIQKKLEYKDKDIQQKKNQFIFRDICTRMQRLFR